MSAMVAASVRCPTAATTGTVSVVIAAAIRTGRCFKRNESTSAIVNLPVLRSSSATSSSATSHATRNPME